jgi:hypothetical protein
MSSASLALRLASALLALAAGIGAVTVVALRLRAAVEQPPGTTAAAPAPASGAPKAPVFPAPPDGAAVVAGEAGDWAVALAYEPRGARVELQASVVGPEGAGVAGLRARFRAITGSRAVEARGVACGLGCYRLASPLDVRPSRVVVSLSGHGRERTVSLPAPAEWPPRPAAGLVLRAGAAYRALRSLTIDERLASAPGNALHTRWTIVAPDRLAYRIAGGSAGIVIGGVRWDRAAGGRWRRSAQTPLREPTPFWGAGPVRDAFVLGSGRVAGRAARAVSFFAPALRAWFTVWVEDATARPLELSMTAAAHFMHHSYGSFDAPLSIEPPG